MRQVLVPARIDPAGPAWGGVVHTLSGQSMGTTWSVRWVGPERVRVGDWAVGIQRQLDRVVSQMSHWDADSDLGRFNRARPGHWQDLPAEFFAVLSSAWEVAEATQGAFDPTVGALVDAWGFGATGRFDTPGFSTPEPHAIAQALSCSGWQKLTLDGVSRRACQPGGLRLDLSSIAKGFAVDQVMSHLRRCGVSDALVEVGGELRGIGVKPDGQPWWVALESPLPEVAAPDAGCVVALHGLSVATSGDYRQGFVADGTRHAHTLDARLGRPVAHGVASVSVIHESCMLADAWSTALTVLGLDAGLEMANARGLAARFMVRHGPERLTAHWSRPFAALLS